MRPTVTLYTRVGCLLCAEAESALRRLAARLRFDLSVTDIEADEELHRRFLFEVPVVAVGDRIVAQAPIDIRRLEEDLREALRALD
ncbi:hypothetical protein HRbin29_02199 [bacterium HR29]|nr:hypothetical protein HRbin29_02199 [bacterium HR29]